jgi:8-amino-7-oxononanoate synthase
MSFINVCVNEGLVVNGNEKVTIIASHLSKAGYQIFPIRAPTVPEGKERLRIVLHAHNTNLDVTSLCEAISSYLQQQV